MFKRNIFKILAVVFFLLSGASFYNSNKNVNNKSFDVAPDKQFVKKIISSTEILTPTIFSTGIAHPTAGEAGNSPTEPTQIIILPTNTPIPQIPLPTEVLTNVDQSLKVSLTINGSSVGTIDVSNGANQCDVLSQALSSGKIQSLNMRYNSDMGTNAVYQINGVGKENAVWWTYKVNGQSPSQGCSYIKVNNGDSAKWNYLGN